MVACYCLETERASTQLARSRNHYSQLPLNCGTWIGAIGTQRSGSDRYLEVMAQLLMIFANSRDCRANCIRKANAHPLRARGGPALAPTYSNCVPQLCCQKLDFLNSSRPPSFVMEGSRCFFLLLHVA